MEEAQRLLNPWVLHLQKLGLELKCPLCLQLFNRPVLLPCNHIFCTSCMPKAVQLGSECPSCKHQYLDREAKPASFLENIVTIYRNIDATFNANLIRPVLSDVGRVSSQCPSFKTDVNNNSRKENDEIVQSGISSNGQSTTSQTAMPSLLNSSAKDLVAKIVEKCITPESGQKQKFNKNSDDKDKPSVSNSMGQVATEKHIEQLSPPISTDSKDMDGNCSDPTSTHRNGVRYSPKRPVENDAYGMNLESNTRPTPGSKRQTLEVKRQKKTNDESNDKGLQINGTVSCNLETKFVDVKRGPCAFCNSSKQTDASGPLMTYDANGNEVVGSVANSSKVTHVHQKCVYWSPQIYFKDGIIQNLEKELTRARKLKCTSCGKKGAGLGCYMKTCPRTYHVPCAVDIFECRWDFDEYLMLCPTHASHEFPKEKKLKTVKQDTGKRISSNLNPCTTQLNGGNNFVFCGSALSAEEKCLLAEFARNKRAVMSRYWRPNVTHVIAATDSNGACTRTLKVLMAILNGKWIITVEWVKACMEAGCLVYEEPYEVHLDTHGCSGGPKAGRQRLLNNGPKLFNNLKFYFVGDFVQAFKTDLLNLVKTAGGRIIEAKDELLFPSNDSVDEKDVNGVCLVVYNADLSDKSEFDDDDSVKFQRLAAAEDIAQESGSQTVGHTWILESIAACRLLPFTSRG